MKKDTEWEAQDLFSVFANFDYDLFGTTQYILKDGRLLGKKKDELLIVQRHVIEGKQGGTDIAFNNSQLGSASTATILHEAVHAWIDYKFPLPVKKLFHDDNYIFVRRFFICGTRTRRFFTKFSETVGKKYSALHEAASEI